MSSLNLPLILTLAVLVTGLIWLVDLLVLARLRRAKAADAKEPVLVEYAKSFFPVLFVVFFLRSFLVEPFQIPSGSMIPTLQVGDFILVNKFAYGIRVPVINKTFIPVENPKRGDVMVFFPPHQPKTYFIKRVIGLPGDKIRYTNNVLYLNGVEVKDTLVKKAFPEWGSFCMNSRQQMSIVEESLDGVLHKAQKCDIPSQLSVDGSWVVPAGHYFMISEDAIVGKAFAVWMHWDDFFSIPSFSNVGIVK
jgi:signal peptidase I